MNEGQTHWVGCWTEPRHHACAITEIERLTAEVECAYFAGWTAARLGKIDDVRVAWRSYSAADKVDNDE